MPKRCSFQQVQFGCFHWRLVLLQNGGEGPSTSLSPLPCRVTQVCQARGHPKNCKAKTWSWVDVCGEHELIVAHANRVKTGPNREKRLSWFFSLDGLLGFRFDFAGQSRSYLFKIRAFAPSALSSQKGPFGGPQPSNGGRDPVASGRQ